MRTIQVSISEEIYKAAQGAASTNTRSINQQIEHWSKIGRFAEAHPFLPYSAIKDIVAGIEQDKVNDIEDFEG